MKAPAIILISPQMGENIGAAARAMHNFGLSDLRLVTPRDGWPNRSAAEVARHALGILDNAKLFNSTKEAVADLHRLYATTARPRLMVKETITPRSCAEILRGTVAQGYQSGIMFGPERTGMENDDIVLADSIITIPVSPDNPSLNLAQAVSVLCYEWYAGLGSGTAQPAEHGHELASKQEISSFLDNLADELTKKGYFKQEDMQERMSRNISNIFTRSNLTSQEVRTLRGIVRYLVGKTE